MKGSIEDLYDEMGGAGWFQVMTSLLIGLCQVPIGWSMLQMSFAGVVPEFYCIVDEMFTQRNMDPLQIDWDTMLKFSPNQTLDACSVNDTKCDRYIYDTLSRNIITEWGLVCDKYWVKKIIISVQMAGVLIGTIGAGQLSDSFGRKKIMYTTALFHFIFNTITGFSASWEMFVCMRFFVGICIGAIIVVVAPFQMEFLPIKWRPLVGVLPTFTLGLGIFAGAAALFEDWTYLHFACGALSFISLFGSPFVPESPRWLAVQGKLEEAKSVIDRIALMNRAKIPENVMNVLESIKANNRKEDQNMVKYTYLDLFRRKLSLKISLVFFYYWFILAVVYYGISFGVGSLSGNLYINLLLLGALEIPVQTTTFCLNNRIGRKMTSLLFFGFALLSLIGCLLSNEVSSDSTKDIAINVLSLTAKMMIGSAWSSIQVWGTESFPTVTRNLGSGFSIVGARVGGILAPFIIDLDEMMSVSYVICCGMLVFGMGLCFVIPETKGVALDDNIKREVTVVSVYEENGTGEQLSYLRAGLDEDEEDISRNAKIDDRNKNGNIL